MIIVIKEKKGEEDISENVWMVSGEQIKRRVWKIKKLKVEEKKKNC